MAGPKNWLPGLPDTKRKAYAINASPALKAGYLTKEKAGWGDLHFRYISIIGKFVQIIKDFFSSWRCSVSDL